jgi:antirestriction protein ArdC
MSAVLSRKKFNVFEAVTTKIVAMIEAGLDGKRYKAPWHAPAAAMAFPVNAATHAPYRGINIVSLWIDAQARGFASPYWASYRQWQSLGAQVRKGERGSMVVFYKRSETRPCDQEDHERSPKLHFVARASTVFNASQVDGFNADEPEPLAMFERILEAEAFVVAVGAVVEHGRAAACYRNRDDVIEMPSREWFLPSQTATAEESYYAVLLHELTHWVGAPHRLNRVFGKRYGDSAYAMEELVAELGAAFLCSGLGISSEPREDHAVYMASWLKVLNSDPKAIFTAASKAQEAYEELAYLATKAG